jgi:hypothetical protein
VRRCREFTLPELAFKKWPVVRHFLPPTLIQFLPFWHLVGFFELNGIFVEKLLSK